jgi:hypothetical protein
MARAGTLLISLGLATGCTEDVDNPTNFSTEGTGAESTTSDGAEGPVADSTTGPAASASGESSTGGGSSSSGGGGSSSGPVAESSSGSGGEDGCGDGVVGPGEQCDGDNLQGFDCASLGLGTGALTCDPVMCSFNTEMCMGGGGTSG